MTLLGLKDCSVGPEEKRKLMEILSRAETDPALDDLDDSDDLHERLENLDLEKDTDQVWERLTDQVLTLLQKSSVFTCAEQGFGKHYGKRRNCSSRAISPFHHSVFYPFVELSTIFSNAEIVVC